MEFVPAALCVAYFSRHSNVRITVQRGASLSPRFFYCAHKERGIVEYYMPSSRNKREFCLFMAIISVISVNIIAPLITCFEMGFSFST